MAIRHRKTGMLTVRMSPAMREAFVTKANREYEMDASRVMRVLIESYVRGNIDLDVLNRKLRGVRECS